MNSSDNAVTELATPAASQSATSEDPRLVAVLEEYRALLETGQKPDRQEFLNRYPDLAAALSECFEGLEFVFTAAPDLRAPATSPPGSVPLGDYRILREVGRGGMGVVYEAEQMLLGRRVALKVLPFAATMDARQLQRFHNEARAAACLHHPNIVPVHAVGCERGVHYYAMQFIEGRSLAETIADLKADAEDSLKRTSPEKPAQANGSTQSPGAPTPPAGRLSTLVSTRAPGYFQAVARLGIQAAQALHHAHEVGVIHRDVKPANLMVDGRGSLWVTDFGLAQIQGDVQLTMSGDLLGTLRYMSPEQALAKRVLVDHRTDVYSLGATLYELLTLEPVFAGGDRQELLRQIAFEDPKPLRRHNKAIPGELETIVGKALEKNPSDRYASAAEIADDLERFLKDEPIRARRPSWRQVARKWARRHRTFVTAAVIVLLLTALFAGGTWLWWVVKRDRAEGEARAALKEAAELQKAERWRDAHGAIRRAQAILAGVEAHRDLRQEVNDLAKDSEMIVRLEEVRIRTLENLGEFEEKKTEVAFAETFAWYGLDVDNLVAQDAGERICVRSIRLQLAAALDEWARVRIRINDNRWPHLVAIARIADPDPWRDRLRNLLGKNDSKALEVLAVSARIEQLPPPTAVLLSKLAQGTTAHERALVILRKLQQRHPSDFWLHIQMVVLNVNPRWLDIEEATCHATAAVALRPYSAGAHSGLAWCLQKKALREQAIFEYRFALRLKPDYGHALSNLGALLGNMGQDEEAAALFQKAIENDLPEYLNLGMALSHLKRYSEAEAAFRKAINLQPNNGHLFSQLAFTLWKEGRISEADAAAQEALALSPNADSYRVVAGMRYEQERFSEAEAMARKAIDLNPKDASMLTTWAAYLTHQRRLSEAVTAYRQAIALGARAHLSLIVVLLSQQKQSEAAKVLEAWQKKLKNNPPDHDDWDGYADVCLLLGKEAEYRSARRALLDRFGSSTHPNVAERTGRSCLLLPASGKELTQAVSLIDRALMAGPSHQHYPYFLFAKGLAEYRLGNFDKAITMLKGEASSVYGPMDLLVLAMSQHRSGLTEEARSTLASAALDHWTHQGPVEHVLRREAEALILPNLEAFLQGKYQPRDNNERLALLPVCQFERRYRAMVDLYCGAFSADSKLADDVRAGRRMSAARAAALAAHGEAIEAADLDPEERARLRNQALVWLRADLVGWACRREIGPRSRSEAHEQMQIWLKDDAFTGVREPEALAKLPEGERQAWRKLWADVETLRNQTSSLN